MPSPQPRQLARRARRSRAESLIANLAVAILALLTAVCLGLIAPILLTVILESGTPKLLPACATIKNVAERAACRDRQADPAP